MKRFGMMLAVTCVVALALSAVSAAGAQAARFTASATGDIVGTQTNNQVFTVVKGGKDTVTCKKAHTTGTIIATDFSEQKVTVQYSECTAVTSLGTFTNTTVSNAEFNLVANGGVGILNKITIHVPAPANCDIIVEKQTPGGSVSYDNSAGKIEETSAVETIVSTSTGLCPHGSTGTYSGNNLLERVGGGTLTWDAV